MWLRMLLLSSVTLCSTFVVSSCPQRRNHKHSIYDFIVSLGSNVCHWIPDKFRSKEQKEINKMQMIKYKSKNPEGIGTAIYVDGWQGSTDSAKIVPKALLQKYKNVLVLDVRVPFSAKYFTSANRVKHVAYRLYEFIRTLVDEGTPLESIHLVGFSLGAQVTGIAGKLVHKHMNRKLERIISLDPAAPCFTRTPDRVDNSSAKFVEVYHSSWNEVALHEPLGHMDLYISEEKRERQRRKLGDLYLEHALAWRVFADSILWNAPLITQRCNDYDDVLAKKCEGDLEILKSENDARGMFFYKISHAEIQKLNSELTSNKFNGVH